MFTLHDLQKSDSAYSSKWNLDLDQRQDIRLLATACFVKLRVFLTSNGKLPHKQHNQLKTLMPQLLALWLTT